MARSLFPVTTRSLRPAHQPSGGNHNSTTSRRGKQSRGDSGGSSSNHNNSNHSSSAEADSSIRRGAAMIRKEISRSLFSDASEAENTEFSDLWNNSNNNNNNNAVTPTKNQKHNSNNVPSPDDSLVYSIATGASEQLEVRSFASKGDASTWAKGSVLVSPESLSADEPATSSPTYIHHYTSMPNHRRSETPIATNMARDRAVTVNNKTYLYRDDYLDDDVYNYPHPHHSGKSNRENQSYDFIADDYVEEFELDDYDEVCHPLYSRQTSLPSTRKANSSPRKTQRAQTPPKLPPRIPVDAPTKRSRAKTPLTPTKQEGIKVVGVSPPSGGSRSISSSVSPDTVESIPAVFDECRQGPPSPCGSDDQQHHHHQQQQQQQQQQQEHQHVYNYEVPSPLQVEFNMLMQDPAFLHAQQAGHLWQSLVGHHIRFPSRWWNGARAPPLGESPASSDDLEPWQYFGRYASHDPRLRTFCKNRAAPGRLLLHIVMLDLVTCKPLQDIVVGCFHPSARGVRTTEQPNRSWEGVRDLWLAIRKREPGVSVMDKHLQLMDPTKGPLGTRCKVTNQNVRAVFGESPPVETLFVPESYLFELYSAALKAKPMAPPAVLLQEFVFAS